MSISSPKFLNMLLLGSLFCVLMKTTKVNRDQKGITIKTIRSKKENSLFTGVAIIIVITLIFIISSGCTAKEPTTIINNNNASQTASEKTELDAQKTPTPSNESSLSVSADPTGASVYLDGTYQGITPIILRN